MTIFFLLADQKLIALKKKIEKAGTPLKDWNIDMNRGVLTGYDDAFIVDKITKDRLIAEDPKSADLLKPVLRGRDIKKWHVEFADLWLIGTFPARDINIDDYPAIKKHLEHYRPRIDQTGEKGSRKKTKHQWFETQDTTAYWQDLEKEKIVYPNMTKHLPFYHDKDGAFYINPKAFYIKGEKLNYIAAVLNSSTLKWWMQKSLPKLGEGAREVHLIFFENAPIPQISETKQAPFVTLEEEINNLYKILQSKDNKILLIAKQKLGIALELKDIKKLESFHTCFEETR